MFPQCRVAPGIARSDDPAGSHSASEPLLHAEALHQGEEVLGDVLIGHDLCYAAQRVERLKIEGQRGKKSDRMKDGRDRVRCREITERPRGRRT